MFILYLLITGVAAGIIGSLLGLGGGIIVIPVLTILFHLPIKEAIAISLVGVVATSTGAAAVYVKAGKTNIRLGMTLELATTIGAIVGALIAGMVSSKILYYLFAALLFYNTYSMFRKKEKTNQTGAETAVASDLQAGSAGYQNTSGEKTYRVRNLPVGMFFSALAGILSGLLGIGGGLVKIPVMYLLMGVPLKTAAATSNFMIGVTATASAFIYFLNGSIDVAIAVPVALGIFFGAMIGTKLNAVISTDILKKIFIVIFLYNAVQMVIKGMGS